MHPGALRLTDRAVRLAALDEGMHVADIGCGTGVTAAFLTGKHKLKVVGLEISGNLIDIGLKNNPGLKLIRWDCDTFPFEDNSMDAIFFECTLSIIGNTQRILSQCAKALKSGGMLIISDLFMNTEDRKYAHRTLAMLAEALSSSNFDILVQEEHTPALRTYLAELKAHNGDDFELGSFFGTCGDYTGLRLSDFTYMLIIAGKI